MRGVSVTDPAEFRDRAGPLLMADELRHTIQLAVLAQIERGGRFAEHHLWVVEDGDRAVACAMMTPPFHVLVAGDEGEALGELAATIRGDGVVVPGVTGFLPEAREFATRWAGATGAVTKPVMSMRMYATSAVTPAPAATAQCARRERAIGCFSPSGHTPSPARRASARGRPRSRAPLTAGWGPIPGS